MSKKFKNLTDVLVAKERYKYQSKVKEENLIDGFDDFRYGLIDATRNSVFKLGTKAITAVVVNLFQQRYRKKKQKKTA